MRIITFLLKIFDYIHDYIWSLYTYSPALFWIEDKASLLKEKTNDRLRKTHKSMWNKCCPKL